MKMGYRAATGLSIGALVTKCYGEKDGDTPQIPNINFSRFMTSRNGLNFGGVPPPMGDIH